MKILLLVDDYLPKTTKIHGKMVHHLAKGFLKIGHNCTVVTPDNNITSNYEYEVLEGVNVYRFKAPETRVNSKVKRAVNELLLSFYARKNLKQFFKEEKFDFIISYSPTIFFGPLVSYLKSKWNCKTYLILRDVFPQWAIDQGMIVENSLIANYFRFFERLNYNAADRIGLQSPKNLEWFNSKYNLKLNTEVLYNWSSETSMQKESNYFREKYNLNNKTVFFYGGNMGEAQDMMNLVRLAKSFSSEEHAHFVFAGSGNQFDLIEERIREDNQLNILLLPPVSQEDYKIMLKEFDIGLFTLHAAHTTHNFPGKLLGYMAQGLPILGSVNPNNDVIQLINNSGAGYVSENGNDKGFVDNALSLLQNADLRRKMGEKSKALLNSTFSTEIAVHKILNSTN